MTFLIQEDQIFSIGLSEYPWILQRIREKKITNNSWGSPQPNEWPEAQNKWIALPSFGGNLQTLQRLGHPISHFQVNQLFSTSGVLLFVDLQVSIFLCVFFVGKDRIPASGAENDRKKTRCSLDEVHPSKGHIGQHVDDDRTP